MSDTRDTKARTAATATDTTASPPSDVAVPQPTQQETAASDSSQPRVRYYLLQLDPGSQPVGMFRMVFTADNGLRFDRIDENGNWVEDNSLISNVGPADPMNDDSDWGFTEDTDEQTAKQVYQQHFAQEAQQRQNAPPPTQTAQSPPASGQTAAPTNVGPGKAAVHVRPYVRDGHPVSGYDRTDDAADEVTDVGDDLDLAVRLMAEGKRVRLDQPHQVSTLIDRLAKVVNDARAAGREQPFFDLCKVTVKDTNLFCKDSKGYERIQMPQLKGEPLPGSRADALPKNPKGLVNLGDQFREHIVSLGVKVEDATERPHFLRATQRELDAVKAAELAKAMREGLRPPDTLFVSRDDYVLDGHHRWAAEVANDAADGTLGDAELKIQRVDLDIGALYEEAVKFVREWGIRPQGAPAFRSVPRFWRGDGGDPDEIVRVAHGRHYVDLPVRRAKTVERDGGGSLTAEIQDGFFAGLGMREVVLPADTTEVE